LTVYIEKKKVEKMSYMPRFIWFEYVENKMVVAVFLKFYILPYFLIVAASFKWQFFVALSVSVLVYVSMVLFFLSAALLKRILHKDNELLIGY